MSEIVAANSRRVTYFLLLVMLTAIGLRLYGLADLPLAQDDIYTLRDVQRLDLGKPGIRPVYYVLQYALLQVLPPTPLLLRLPPFIFGVLGVWLTWMLGRREFGATAGLVAAFLVAISPWHLYASQFVRYYSLVYVFAVLFYIVLLRALAGDSLRLYVLTLLIVIVGALTHPTFLFPVPGVFLALALFSSEGDVRWTWPSRRAWIFLWGPLTILAVMIASYLLMVSAGADDGTNISNPTYRELAHTLRLILAMVQWVSPSVAAAAVICALYLVLNRTQASYRRWGAIALVGCTSTLTLLMLAAFHRTVYADYGMAMLPLIFVTVGAGIATLGQKLGRTGSGLWAIAATMVLAADILPGTVSHLSDGTRHDFRPAFAYIESNGKSRLILAHEAAITLRRYYSPDLNVQQLKMDLDQLEEVLRDTRGFWVIASFLRHGMIRDNNRIVESWLHANCRQVLQTERPRLDYRTYRVELYWCGASPPSPKQ